MSSCSSFVGSDVVKRDVPVVVEARVTNGDVAHRCSGRQRESDDRRRVIPTADRLRRALRDDPPLRDHDDAVGQPLGLFHVVRGEQHGLAQAAEAFDEIPRGAAGRRVESGRGLVEEHELRVADERERQIEPPLLAAGESLHAHVGLVGEPDELEHLGGGTRRRVAPRRRVDQLGDG